ncbi:MAG: retropepsin-like aspartic protease [Gemmatimonadota bacterium]
MAATARPIVISALLVTAPALQPPTVSMPHLDTDERARIEVPFEMSPRGHIMVEVSVDGGEAVPFALDTGAGITILNQARLGTLGVTERASGEVAQRAHGTVSLGRAEVDALSMGEAVFGGMEVGVMDLTDVEAGQMVSYGILGFDILSRFDVSLDFRNRTVALYPRADDLASCKVCDGEISTPFERAGGTHIRFDVTISDQSIPAILDTGSGRNGMNLLAAAAIGVDLPATIPGGHAPGLNVGAIHMGGGTLARNVPVGVIDLPAFAALGLADGPAILLGTGALAGRRVGISYGLNRISIE